MAEHHWIQSTVGCYWTRGEYSICTVRSGNYKGCYRLYWKRQEFGGRFPTLQDAQQVADHHRDREDR